MEELKIVRAFGNLFMTVTRSIQTCLSKANVLYVQSIKTAPTNKDFFSETLTYLLKRLRPMRYSRLRCLSLERGMVCWSGVMLIRSLRW